MNQKVEMVEMTQVELEQKGIDTVIIPVGSIEQHGPHMLLDTDAQLANRLSVKIAKELGYCVAPPIHYGCRSLANSGGGESFLGSIGIQGSTFSKVLEDVVENLVAKGCKNICVVNGHMENHGFATEALRNVATRHTGIRALSLNWWETVNESDTDRIFDGEFPGWDAEHAGIVETSLMLHLAPELVHTERISTRRAEVAPPEYVVFPERPELVDPSGVLRTAHGADADIGKHLTGAIMKKAKKILNLEFK